MSLTLLFSPSNLKKSSSFFIGISYCSVVFISNKLCPCLLSCSMMGHSAFICSPLHLLFIPSAMPWGTVALRTPWLGFALVAFSSPSLSDFCAMNRVLLQFLFGLSVWAERTLCFPDRPFSLLYLFSVTITGFSSSTNSLQTVITPTWLKAYLPIIYNIVSMWMLIVTFVFSNKNLFFFDSQGACVTVSVHLSDDPATLTC